MGKKISALKNSSDFQMKYEEICIQNEELKAEIWSLTSSYNVLCERFNALAVMHKELVGKTEGK